MRHLDQNRLNWWLPFLIAIAASAVSILIFLSGSFDVNEIVYLFVGVPVVSLILAILLFALGKRRRRTLGISIQLSLLSYWAVTAVFHFNGVAVRDTIRWIQKGKEYRASVFKQPQPPNGELRHVEWDGWGWAGMDTNVYLVFDPSNSLAEHSGSHNAGKLRGIPCEVPGIRKLESNWYVVKFYTDASWNECT
jgi:hypothetical protein